MCLPTTLGEVEIFRTTRSAFCDQPGGEMASPWACCLRGALSHAKVACKELSAYGVTKIISGPS